MWHGGNKIDTPGVSWRLNVRTLQPEKKSKWKKETFFVMPILWSLLNMKKFGFFSTNLLKVFSFSDEPTAVYNRLHGEDNNHKRKAHKHTHTWRVNKNNSFGLLWKIIYGSSGCTRSSFFFCVRPEIQPPKRFPFVSGLL